MKKIVPELSVGLHGGDDLSKSRFILKISFELIGEASRIIDECVIGSPVEKFLERTAKCDAMGMLVHAVEKNRADEDPSWRGRVAALALAMNGGLIRRDVEGER